MPGPERRQSPRTTLETFAYINLGANNYGSVLNISESGLCFRSVSPLTRNRTVHFWFSEHNHRIEAMGEVAWTNETQKTGGLRFTTLSDEARDQIRHWITNPTVPLAVPDPVLPVASLPAPPVIGPGPFEAGAVSSRFSAPAMVPTKIRIPARLSGFSGGLAVGLVVAALVAAIFTFQAYRREIGESLISIGERFAARTQAASQAAAHQPEPQTASSVPEMIPGAPQPVTSNRSQTAPPVSSKPEKSAPPSTADTVKLASAKLDPPTPVQPRIDQAKTERAKPEPDKPDTRQIASTSPVVPNDPPAKNNSAASASLPVSLTPAANSLPAHSGLLVGNLVATKVDPPPVAQPSRSATQVEVAREESKNSKPGPPPQMFLEVGKFKDSGGAHKTKDELAQLGFHTSVMQKNRLWMNSYLVLVGPYSTDEQAQVASQTLESRDFTPRPFERGTRNLTLRPGLMLNGTHMPDGDCTVSWESYATDTLVKIEQDHLLVTKTTGRWVPSQTKYRRDAFVFKKNPDGSRTLLEIQFSGLNKTLVFNSES